MANNRMYLVNKRTGDKVYLAKYYPSTGWYTVLKNEELAHVLNETFDKADFGHLSEAQQLKHDSSPGFDTPHKSPGGMYGDEWELEYECRTDQP